MASGYSVVSGGYFPESLLGFVSGFLPYSGEWGLYQTGNSDWLLILGDYDGLGVYSSCTVYTFHDSGTDNYHFYNLGAIDSYTVNNPDQFLHYGSDSSDFLTREDLYGKASLFGLCVLFGFVLVCRIFRHVS